jgi:Protein phosphatase 2C
MLCRAWSRPKPGRDDEENEDAYEVRLVHGQTGDDSVLLAISDGASSTVYAGSWARTLVAAAQLDWPGLDDETLTARLNMARERFQLECPADPPWYIAQKLSKHGSQAALLVASFKRAPGTDEVLVRTVAVGDCTLVVFRRDGSTTSFPISESASFGPSPRLISTKPQPALQYDRWAASLKLGDVVVACTDAVGRWVLECVESADSESVFRLLLDALDKDKTSNAGTRTADGDLFGRLAESAGPRQPGEDDVTIVLCVPIRPGRTRTPDELARAVLKSHLSDGAGGRPAWLVTAIGSARQALGGGWRK